MAKKRLSKKLKEQIRENPRNFKKSELSPDAVKYLNRIRGARKAVKTKAAKKSYRQPRRKSETAPFTTEDQITDAAKTVGLTAKQFKKKFPKQIQEFTQQNTLSFSRDIEILKNDISFNVPKGSSVYNNGKKIRRDHARYLLVRLQNKLYASEVIYDRIPIEHFYDGKKNLHITIPEPREYSYLEGEEILPFISTNYPNITFYINPKKQKIKNDKKKKK